MRRNTRAAASSSVSCQHKAATRNGYKLGKVGPIHRKKGLLQKHCSSLPHLLSHSGLLFYPFPTPLSQNTEVFALQAGDIKAEIQWHPTPAT